MTLTASSLLNQINPEIFNHFKNLSIMTHSEITLTIVDITGKRFDKGNLGSLENAHHQAVAKWGIEGNQISYDEIKAGLYYAHIMEFRDGEHYNDIYLT